MYLSVDLEWNQVYCYSGHLLYQSWMIDGDGCGAISGMNEWQGKPKYWEKTCPSATTTDPTWLDPGSNPGHHGGKPVTNHLSHGTATERDK
jgi:hypothetical protein